MDILVISIFFAPIIESSTLFEDFFVNDSY